MGASLGNSSIVKEPCEVSNLTMVFSNNGAARREDPLSPLGLGHALVPGEIAVGAYVTEPTRHKLAGYCGGLIGAVLEQQPAVTLQVVRGRFDDRSESCHGVQPRRQGAAGLIPQGRVLHRWIVRRDVRRI